MVLSVLAAALAAAAIALWLVVTNHQRARRDHEVARTAAVSAARQAIKNLDSLSAPTVDADVKRIVEGATGMFKDQFSKAQVQLKQIVVQRKTSSTATVLSAGVERSDSDTARVLVAVDRTVKDSTTPQGVVAHDRWKLELEKHAGRWLVADLEPVS